MAFARILCALSLAASLACSNAGVRTDTELSEVATSAAPSTRSEDPEPAGSEVSTPDAEATSEPESAAALFVPLPRRYSYNQPPRDVRRQLVARLASSGGEEILHDVAVRYVEKGSVPVAAVMAFRFNDAATTADVAGFLRGAEQSSGVTGRAVRVGGKDVTFLPADPPGFVYAGDRFVLAFFGDRRADMEPVVTAIVRKVD